MFPQFSTKHLQDLKRETLGVMQAFGWIWGSGKESQESEEWAVLFLEQRGVFQVLTTSVECLKRKGMWCGLETGRRARDLGGADAAGSLRSPYNVGFSSKFN